MNKKSKRKRSETVQVEEILGKESSKKLNTENEIIMMGKDD